MSVHISNSLLISNKLKEDIENELIFKKGGSWNHNKQNTMDLSVNFLTPHSLKVPNFSDDDKLF